jgi:hypothetical protein
VTFKVEWDPICEDCCLVGIEINYDGSKLDQFERKANRNAFDEG